jgi:hypothetical protein
MTIFSLCKIAYLGTQRSRYRIRSWKMTFWTKVMRTIISNFERLFGFLFDVRSVHQNCWVQLLRRWVTKAVDSFDAESSCPTRDLSIIQDFVRCNFRAEKRSDLIPLMNGSRKGGANRRIIKPLLPSSKHSSKPIHPREPLHKLVPTQTALGYKAVITRNAKAATLASRKINVS